MAQEFEPTHEMWSVWERRWFPVVKRGDYWESADGECWAEGRGWEVRPLGSSREALERENDRLRTALEDIRNLQQITARLVAEVLG